MAVLIKAVIAFTILIYSFIGIQKLYHYLPNVSGSYRKKYWVYTTYMSFGLRAVFVAGIIWGFREWEVLIMGVVFFVSDRFKAGYLDEVYGEVAITDRKNGSVDKALFRFLNDMKAPWFIKRYDMATDKFIMVFVNEKYEKLFLKPRGLTITDYIGKTDFDVHTQEIAQKYEDEDRMVFFDSIDSIQEAPYETPNGIEVGTFTKTTFGDFLVGYGSDPKFAI